MLNKRLTCIVACVAVGAGALAAGKMISGSYWSRHAYGERYQQVTEIMDRIADFDSNGEVTHEERGRIYCIIKGEYKKGGDPELTFEEKERWILGHGYGWNETAKKYEYTEPIKPEEKKHHKGSEKRIPPHR